MIVCRALCGPVARAFGGWCLLSFILFVSETIGRGQTVTVTCPQAIQVQCARLPVDVVPITVQVCNTSGMNADVVWSVNGTPVETNVVPSMPAPGCSNVTYYAALPPGNHTVNIVVSHPAVVWGQCNVPVTVNLDNQPPTLQCPALLTNVVNKDCLAEVPRVEVIVSDNCALPSDIVVWQTPAYGAMVPVGTNWITIYAQDPQGNLATCQVPYVVLDPTPPQVTCPGPLTLQAGANCQVPMPKLPVEVADDCTPLSLMTIVQTPAPGTLLGAGTHPVTITVSDSSGHTVTCQTAVTIQDLTPPVLACPTNVTLVAGADCSAVLPALNITATDGCDGTNVVVNQSPPPGTVLSPGVHPVTVSACDSAGNCSTCTVMVAVVPAVSGPWDWATGVGGTNADVGRGVARLPNGDVVVVGEFSSPATVGGASLASAGGRDIFVARFTPAGLPVWVTQAGGPNDDYGRGVTADSSGNIYVCGYVSGNAQFGSIPATGYFGYVAKLDGAGNWVWVQHVAPTYGDAFRVRVHNGKVVVAGWFMDSFNLSGVGTLTSVGGADALVVALDDATGTPLWAWTAGDVGTDAAHDVASAPNGDVLVTGPFGTGAPHAVNFGGASLTTFGGQDVFVVRLSPNGSLLWATNAGGLSDDVGMGVAVDATGHAYVTGDFKPAPGSATAQFGATTLAALGNQSIFVAKLDPAGAFLWATNAGGGYFDFARAITVTALGESYVAGHTWNGVFGSQTASGTGSEAFVARLDASGQFTGVWSAGGSGDDGANDVAQADVTGCVFVTGLFRTGPAQFPPSPSLAGAGLDDAFVARLCTSCASNAPPAVQCPPPIHLSCVSTAGLQLTLSVVVGDAEGDPLTVVWLGNGTPLQTNLAASGPAPTQTTVTFTGQFTPGTNLVTVIVTDPNGGSDSCVVPVVLLADAVPPAVYCKNAIVTLKAGTNCTAILPALLPNSMSDNCTPQGQLVVTQNPPAGTQLSPGTHTVVITVTDAAGNSASCVKTVKVVEGGKPWIQQCPPAYIVTNCQAIIPDLTHQVVAADNCDTKLTVTQLPPPGTVVGPGTHQIVLTVTDASGNSVACATTLTVQGPLLPSLAGPLPSTGVDISGQVLPAGGVDPHFALVQGPVAWSTGQAYANPLLAFPTSGNSAWIAPLPPAPGGETSIPAGVYVYRYLLSVPPNVSCVITGRWAVDNEGRILLNGQDTGNAVVQALPSDPAPFTQWHPFQIASGFVPGTNVIDFVVTNHDISVPPLQLVLQTPSKLRVEWWVNFAACPPTCHPPFIGQQPASQIQPWGGMAVLTVVAGGTWPLSFQWYKNGTPLPGATGSSLTLGPVNYGHQGHYTVVVSNSCGAVTSQVAVVLVKAVKGGVVGSWTFRNAIDPLAAEAGEPMQFIPSDAFLRQPQLGSFAFVPATWPCPPPPEESPYCDGFYGGADALLLRINPWYDGTLRIQLAEAAQDGVALSEAGTVQRLAVIDLGVEEPLEDGFYLLRNCCNDNCRGQTDDDTALMVLPGGHIRFFGQVATNAIRPRQAHRIAVLAEYRAAGTVRHELYLDGGLLLVHEGPYDPCAGFNLRMNKAELIDAIAKGSKLDKKVYLGGVQVLESRSLVNQGPALDGLGAILLTEDLRSMIPVLGTPANGPLEVTEPVGTGRSRVTFHLDGRELILQWEGDGTLLEEAESLDGPWRISRVPVVTRGAAGPVHNEARISISPDGSGKFYRSRRTGVVPHVLETSGD